MASLLRFLASAHFRRMLLGALTVMVELLRWFEGERSRAPA